MCVCVSSTIVVTFPNIKCILHHKEQQLHICMAIRHTKYLLSSLHFFLYLFNMDVMEIIKQKENKNWCTKKTTVVWGRVIKMFILVKRIIKLINFFVHYENILVEVYLLIRETKKMNINQNKTLLIRNGLKNVRNCMSAWW